MKWLVKALLGGWYLLGAEDRRKQKRGLVAVDCAAAAGMKGNSMERWWVADGIAAEREVGRYYSHLDHERGSGFENAAVGSRRIWD